MAVRILTEAHLRSLVDMSGAIEAMRGAFAALSSGAAVVPVRNALTWEGGTLLTMPGRVEGSPAGEPRPTVAPGRPAEGDRTAAAPGALGAKLVTVVPGNVDRGMTAIHALVVLLSPETGQPVAVMDGEWLTALRTGAGSGLATELLALPDARVLAVVGAGVQARTQIEAVRCVRPINEIRVVSRTRSSAERLARELQEDTRGIRVDVVDRADEAVAGAQVVATATDATDPVVPETLDPGTHVNAVGGYRPDMQELPSALVAGARVFVDHRPGALAEAGELLIPLGEGLLEAEDVAELGEVVLGTRAGRRDPKEITVFKSVGNAVQDLAVGRLALEGAEAKGLGALL